MRIINLALKYNDLDHSFDGQFSGAASVYNVIDSHGDVVVPGAFTKTIRENGGRVVLLNQHDPAQPIGLAELVDDSKALHVRATLNLDTQLGRDVYSNLKAGIINGLSIGFQTVRDRVVKGVREILEVSLWEVSCVTFPANTFARITSVKGITARDLEAAQRAHKPYRDAIEIASRTPKPTPGEEQAKRMSAVLKDLHSR
jgi:HK97 family phage prohead protease